MDMAGSVIIIGAGAAGLYAASLLAEKNFEITILEARGRCGGRIHTLNLFSQPAEAGAEFVHGSLPITTKLIKSACVKSSKVKGSFYELNNGEYADADFLNDEVEEVSEKMKKLSRDIPFLEFMSKHLTDKKYDKVRKHLTKMVEGYDGADPAHISTFALRDEWSEWNDEDDFRIEGGYGTIIRHLEDSARKSNAGIHLSCTVKKISWKKGIVTVTTNTGDFHAEKVLITVPVSVLQSELISFEPYIRDYIDAARKIGFGGVVKFLFEFKEDIKRLQVFKQISDLGFILSDSAIPTWWSQRQHSNYIITGWLGGPKAFSFTRNIDEQYQIAIDALSYILKTHKAQVEAMLLGWSIHDWVADPFCRGAYAYATPETKEARQFLNQPIDNTIFFAGEAISEGDSMGTVEAAFESAEKSIKKIMNQSKG
jgi:monoamine oxidase